MKQEQNKRVKRIKWVCLVVDVAIICSHYIMSVAILRDSSRVYSSSSKLARFARSPVFFSLSSNTPRLKKALAKRFKTPLLVVALLAVSYGRLSQLSFSFCAERSEAHFQRNTSAAIEQK